METTHSPRMRTAVHSPQEHSDTGPWRRAWCRLYDTPAGDVRLGRIVHWRAVAEHLGTGVTLDRDRALVTRGFFYQPHTPPPDIADIRADRAAAARLGARWVLYPVIRLDAVGVLADLGATVLPWFLEAEYVARDEIDRDLRTLLGGKRFRDLRRLVRRADEQYSWEVFTGAEIDDEVLSSFDRLHRMNLAKYGHRHNHFALPILRDLGASALRDRLTVFRRRGADGAPVQAVLALRGTDPGTLDLLVHGIDHAIVPATQNLYAAALYRIYRWGQARGVRRFALGRGAERVKLDLGANRFHVVANALLHADGADPAAAGAGPLRDAARAAIERPLRELGSITGRRGRTGTVRLPGGAL
ncbi:GNAT family N-acetyltransferase [Nocardia sp. NPDC001965]